MRGVTLRQLRAFLLVARHHSFVQAAAELHLTPSAVSLQIKELEQAVGMPLFSRSARASSLTGAGEVLLADVQRALAALQHAEETLARLRARHGGAVIVGMVSSAKYILPRLLAQFHLLRPEVPVQLTVANREHLLEQLCRGQVDLAIMGAPPADLEGQAQPFASQPLAVVAAPEHELAFRRAVPASALAEHHFVVREPGSGTRAAMVRFFAEAHVQPRRLLEHTGNDAVKHAVLANMGLAFVSLHAVALELQCRLLVVVDVIGLPVTRTWYAVHMHAPGLGEGARCLRDFIVVHAAGALVHEFPDGYGPSPVPAPYPAATH